MIAYQNEQQKSFVFALFSQNEKSSTLRLREFLIFTVDQTGLKPVTSRL